MLQEGGNLHMGGGGWALLKWLLSICSDRIFCESSLVQVGWRVAPDSGRRSRDEVRRGETGTCLPFALGRLCLTSETLDPLRGS